MPLNELERAQQTIQLLQASLEAIKVMLQNAIDLCEKEGTPHLAAQIQHAKRQVEVTLDPHNSPMTRSSDEAQ